MLRLIIPEVRFYTAGESLEPKTKAGWEENLAFQVLILPGPVPYIKGYPVFELTLDKELGRHRSPEDSTSGKKSLVLDRVGAGILYNEIFGIQSIVKKMAGREAAAASQSICLTFVAWRLSFGCTISERWNRQQTDFEAVTVVVLDLMQQKGASHLVDITTRVSEAGAYMNKKFFLSRHHRITMVCCSF